MAKFLMLFFGSIITFLPGLIAFWHDGQLLRDYFFCLVYCLGYIPFLCLAFGLGNYRKIDIAAKGVFANWEGLGSNQVLIGIPFFFPPVVFFILGNYLGQPGAVFWMMALLGAAMIFTNGLWINYIASRFGTNKYRMFEGFTTGIEQSKFK